MTVLAPIAFALAALALAVVLGERRRRREQTRWIEERRRLEQIADSNGIPSWEWPRRSVNSHDGPEPDELVPEERT